MGTSTAYSGPGGGTPLIPSWLGPGDEGNPQGEPPANAPETPDGVPLAPADRPAIAAPTIPDRFLGVRSDLTRFARSGGTDRGRLGKAVSGYVSKASGGAKQASLRMGASRQAGAALYGFLSNVQEYGVRDALRQLNLESLAGRPISEVFLGLADHICPDGGTVDEGIAREAFIESMIELTEQGVTDLETLTSDQIQTVFEMFTTHAIEARICNDIGTKTIMMPANADAAIMVQEQLRDFIRNAVSDALTIAREENPVLTQDRVQSFVDSVYERAFVVLQALGNAEADQ